MGTEKFDTIDLRTGKHHAAISNPRDFNKLKNHAHKFLNEPANADPELRNELLDPLSTLRNNKKSRVIYELFARVLGSCTGNNTQLKKGSYWQTHYFKIILNQWIASLDDKERGILIDLKDLDENDENKKNKDPLLKLFIIENGALKVKEKIQIARVLGQECDRYSADD